MRSDLAIGTPVTFTLGPLGTTDGPTSNRLTSQQVFAGDTGRYYGPPLNPELITEGWHIIQVSTNNGNVYCPAHESMFTTD